jgi:hypothetical protein
MRKRKDYALSSIGNMDETPIWMDMPGERTMEFSGKKTIRMTSTGHEKSRITVCLAALADGTKLLPLVLMKGVRPLKDVPTGVVVRMTPKSWADESVMKFWLHTIWRKKSHRRLLVWDSFSGHKTKAIKELLSGKYNTDMAIIPGGCTSKLQPCDVSWNKPFKDRYRELYDDWLYNDTPSLTKQGNRRPPEKKTILRWIKEAWASVSPDIIRKSFLKTGISNNLDGTEDDVLFQSDGDESDDPFEGFDVPTDGDREGLAQFQENIQMELDAVNEWSDATDASDLEEEVDSDPGSPGR